MTAYPESDRLLAVSAKSQAIGEFLEWLQDDQDVFLCRLSNDVDDYGDNVFYPEYVSIEKRLARYFKIDLNKVDAEKRAMLESIRAAQ